MTREPMRPPDVEMDDDEGEPMTGRWKADRHVPIALIVSMGLYALAQSAATGYWVATVNSRVDAADNRVSAIERQIISSTSAAAPVSERLVRLETKFDSVKETVDKIEALIRQPARNP